MGLCHAGGARAESCGACRTRDCCHDRDVALKADEVTAIARTLAVAPERFARLVPDGGARLVLVRGGPGHRIVLRRRPDGEGRTRCVFLVTAGSGRKICGLGELAPSACKTFPRAEEVGANGRAAGCWKTWETSPGQAREDAREAEAERRHEAAIARWDTVASGREHRLPEDAFLHALLADHEIGHAGAREDEASVGGAGGGEALAGGLPEADSRSGCATCATARCCVIFDPEMTGHDLHRLVRGLGLDVRDVCELKPTHGGQAGADGIRLGDDQVWDLRLRRTGARAGFTGPGGRRRCGFLMDLSADERGLTPASRCGVYRERPLVCRLFPSDLTAFGVMVGSPTGVCPPDAWAQERADLVTLRTLHLIARREREIFRAFVCRWNTRAEAIAELDLKVRAARFTETLLRFHDHLGEREGEAAIEASFAAATAPA